MRLPVWFVVCLWSGFAAGPAWSATTLSLSATPNPSRLGSPVELTATLQGCVPAPGARITFYDGVTVLGQWPAGAAAPFTTTLLEAGPRKLRARFAGDGLCAAAASQVVTQTVIATASNYFHWRGSYLSSVARLAVADFNGDRIPDLAAAANTAVSVLLGKGDATFTRKGDYGAGFTSSAVAAGDWNGDGKPDLAISGAGKTAVLIGNGDGSFQVPQPVLDKDGLMAVADFDGDGRADLAVSSAADRAVYVLLSNGDGSFRSVKSSIGLFTPAAPAELAVGDFNRDGLPDLVLTHPSAAFVSVLLNLGGGRFIERYDDSGRLGEPAFYPVGLSPGAVAVADFNDDGFADIAAYGLGLVVFLGNGDGTFQSSDNYFLGGLNSFVPVDFNGDGILDVVGTNDDLDEPHMVAAAGNGDGSFQPGWNWTVTGGSPHGIVSADFDGDGRSDFAIVRFAWVDVMTGVTANMALRGTPQSAEAGTPYPSPLQVTVVDSAGLPMPNIQIEPGFGRTDASGTVSRTASASPTPGLTLMQVSVIGAPADGGLASGFGTAAFVLLSAAPPTSLDALTGPQSAEAGARFIAPLQVRLANTAGVPVTFTAPSSGASATLSSTTAVTDIGGYAGVVATANTVTGSYTVTAAAAGFTATFALTNIARSLAGCWTLDAAAIAGNQALDCSGNGLTGTISGDVTPTPGALDEGLRFNGGSIAIPDSAATDLTHDLTLGVWVKSTNASQRQNFLSKYDFSASESGYLLQLLPGGIVNLRIGGANLAFGSRDATDTTVINDGKWHHVAAVITLGGNVKFYIDGRLRSTVAQGAASSRTTSPLRLGTLPGAYNGLPFVGSLDDARIFSRALTAGEVAALLGVPSITAIAPESVPAGRTAVITVNGSGFVPSSVVIEPDLRPYPPSQLPVFPTTFVSPTQLTATLPLELVMSPTSLRLQAFNASQSGVVTGFPFGPGSNIVRYTIDPLIPELASLSPYFAQAGGSSFLLTVKGANFIPDCVCPTEPVFGSRIYWNETRLDPVAMSETSVSSIVPAGLLAAPGKVTIRVANPIGAFSRGLVLTVGSGPSQLTLACAPVTGPQQAGAFYSTTCTASGGSPPYVLGVSPGLPEGLSVTSTTANSITISGVPASPGAYSFSVSARDSKLLPQTSVQAFNGIISGGAPPPPPPAAIAGYWSFDAADISGSQALDRSGNGLNGAIVNAVSMPGRVNQALRFGGAGSYVSVPNNAGLQLSGDLSLAAWIQTSNNSQKQSFLSKYDFSGAEYGYMLQVLPTGVVNLRLGGNNVSGTTRDFTDTAAVNNGQWHHLAVVITSGAATFYVDGQLSSTRPLSRLPAANPAPLYLGTFPGSYNGLPFTGSLDEVRVYSKALSASEAAALAVVPPAPLALVCSPAGGPAARAAYSQTCAASGGTPPYTLSAAGLPAGLAVSAVTATTITISGTPLATGAYTYIVRVIDSAAPSANTATLTITGEVKDAAPPSTLAGYWTFDRADISGIAVADRSGHGLTGTLSANTSAIAGKANEALAFAGGYVAVPDAASLQLQHDLTLTAWIRAAPQPSAQNFLSKYDFSGAETGYILQLLPSGVLNLRLGGNSLASGVRDARDTTIVGDSQWHHVAVVIALGQNVKFYVDGQLRSTQPVAARASGHTTPLYLGSFPGAYTGIAFFGDLDEVRVYSSALSAAEIAALI